MVESISALRRQLAAAKRKKRLEQERERLKRELRGLKTERVRNVGRLFITGARITGRSLAKGVQAAGAVGRSIEADDRRRLRVTPETLKVRRKRRRRR